MCLMNRWNQSYPPVMNESLRFVLTGGFFYEYGIV
jgi:hypothetical protein